MPQRLSRQHPRFPLQLPLLCQSPVVPGYRTAGLTQDMSRGGLLLQVREPPALGTRLSLLLLAGDRVARAEALVVRMVEDCPECVGVRFTVLTGGDRLSLERLLAYQATTPRAFIRIPVALEVTCPIPTHTRLTGRVENLGHGGLMISFAENLGPRTPLTVVVPPWGTLPLVTAKTEVVWTRAAPKRRGVLHGLRFLADDIGKELFITGSLLRQFLTADVRKQGRGVPLLAILAMPRFNQP